MSYLKSFGLVFLVVAVLIGYVDHKRKSSPPTYPSFSTRPRSPYRVDSKPPEKKPLAGKTALVTGANGFIGATLVEELLQDGWTVLAMHRKGSDISTLKDIEQRFLASKGDSGKGKLQFVVGDVTSFESLKAVIPQGLPVVFHVAALIKTWMQHYDIMYRVNVLGTRNVVDACLARGVDKLVHTSTTGVYEGDNKPNPVVETSPKLAKDHWNGYSNTKYLAELEVLGGIEDGLWATMLNPGAVVGKYDVSGFARTARMLKANALPGLPFSNVSFVHSKAVAQAHIAAAKVGRLGENYLLAGQSRSMHEVMQVVGEELGVDGNLPVLPKWAMAIYGVVCDVVSIITNQEPEVTSEIVDIASQVETIDSSKAQKELGLSLEVDMAEGVRESIRWLVETNKV